jgi:hypothetical protein
VGKVTRTLYRLARLSNTVGAVTSGSPARMRRRATKIVRGRLLRRSRLVALAVEMSDHHQEPPEAASELGCTYDANPSTLMPLHKPVTEIDFEDARIRAENELDVRQREGTKPEDIEIDEVGRVTAEEFIDRQNRKWSADRERNRPIRMKDIGREGWHYWVRDAWTFLIQSNQPEKVLVVERIRHTHRVGKQAMPQGAVAGDVEYRFGYYLIRRIGKARGSWGWGQYSPMIPQTDLRRLLDKARSEGTISGDLLGGSAVRSE